MKHEMHLHHEPFEFIKNRTKTVEIRLYDEKRSLMNVGDIIEFTSRKTEEKVNTKIIGLHKYKNFEELFKYYTQEQIGFKKDKEVTYKDMEEFYPIEEQEKYGVVAIEIKVID